MIVTCDGCKTKYLLGDEKVPEKGIRVRCPMCRYVWKLVPQLPKGSVFEVNSGEFSDEVPVAEAPGSSWASMERQGGVVMAEPEAEPVHEEIEISDTKPAVPREEVSESPELRKKMERARRLARVFVSDILVYNEEKRNQGLANGNLMTVLGPEVKKAWEAYKEKIGSSIGESSNYFRDALNEILADGQKIF